MSLLILTASRFEAEGLARRLPGHPAPQPVGVGPVAAALGTAALLSAGPPPATGQSARAGAPEEGRMTADGPPSSSAGRSELAAGAPAPGAAVPAPPAAPAPSDTPAPASAPAWSACLLLGLAGTRDPRRVPVGGLVLANELLDEAVGAGHGRSFIPLAEFGLPAGDRLPQRLPGAVPAPGRVSDPPWTVGMVGTLAAASADPDEAAAWHARHPDVLVEEMEGYAVALACRRADVPLAVLRGVCNVAGDRDHTGWHFEQALDAVAAATPVLLDALRPR